jgi:hypothetical protein
MQFPDGDRARARLRMTDLHREPPVGRLPSGRDRYAPNTWVERRQGGWSPDIKPHHYVLVAKLVRATRMWSLRSPMYYADLLKPAGLDRGSASPSLDDNFTGLVDLVHFLEAGKIVVCSGTRPSGLSRGGRRCER